ncbi:hypothetical protein BVRB_8g187540 [Beta vulgaris subsp. vulgaris]|nr:hypothetical protein BVRB_8g187540 [Beta vulgaris subsp. vulgaris]
MKIMRPHFLVRGKLLHLVPPSRLLLIRLHPSRTVLGLPLVQLPLMFNLKLVNTQKKPSLNFKRTLKPLLARGQGLLTSDTQPSSTSEPVIVLKGLVKPVGETGKDGNEMNEDKTSRDEDTSYLKREKDDAERRIGLMGIGKGEVDQATINAIRAERERLRLSRAAAPDFISLDAGSNHGEAEGLSDEEPEFQTRIAMLGEKIDGPKKGVFEDIDERPMRIGQLNMDDDEDEEERKWEEEQFRKGLGKRMDEGPSAVSRNASAVQSVQPQSYMYTAPTSYSSVSHDPAGPPSIGGGIGWRTGCWDYVHISAG